MTNRFKNSHDHENETFADTFFLSTFCKQPAPGIVQQVELLCDRDCNSRFI